MKLRVLALDYDGTIANDGVMDPSVRAALAEVRASGVVTVLVTGRILDQLRAVMGDLRLFDSIVAENGSVIAFPKAGRSSSLGHPPPPSFLHELNKRGIPFTHGECVVEADAGQALPILSVIRDLELPLVLLFNRGRLMILPQAISKATGLRQTLRTLRLSEHNTIAIGDAENDHQLLQACEVGVAVAWGSEALKRVAEEVIEGNGPAAVADYLRETIKHPRLLPSRTARRLLLGTDETGQPLSLAVRGRNVLIAGDSQTGKSWVAGLLCEQLILQHYCVCVIDPEGDYHTLEGLPGVIVLGGDDPPPQARDIMRALRYPDVSLVLDLSKLRLKEKSEYVNATLLLLASMRRETGLPHRIIIDEAHYFLHAPEVTRLIDLELAGYTLVTYRASGVHPDILAATEAIIVTRESDPQEVRALRSLQSDERSAADWEAILVNLAMNEAVLLPGAEEARGKLCRFSVAPRLTAHIRHQRKYLDAALPESKAFVFNGNGAAETRRARTLKEFTAILTVASAAMIDGHLRKGDFSRWIADVYRDYSLASQVREVEKQYSIGQLPDVNDALIQLVQDRYALAAKD